ncbi:hypothetical protein PROFUN_00131 [Planoprotostelium fungivorum]|uniref:Uncharacterized protein n=1 Tax=Planoprotostelium fungivorum TaxID=1890364 RepID=A0A2P6P0T2_9EUKA|nr:hypothetical protein PROFUN_00131 [Planoprotostelium fungivorum]
MAVSLPTQAQQTQDLNDLYTSAGGSSWSGNNGNGWGGTNACNFQNVNCDGNGNVIGVQLNNIGMEGTFPSTFGKNLYYLQTLSITLHYAQNGNLGFHGTLPSTFTQMVNLQYLYIDANELSGIIPDLSPLSQLKQAELEFNRFIGFSTPSGFSALTSLNRLWLFRNNFASIPADIISATSLTSIRAECNYLTSVPSGIWTMSKVNQLNFGYQVTGNQYAVYPTGNRIPGVVPASITSKDLLDLSGNAFDEFEDYNMASPLNSGATSPSGPDFACPIPSWAVNSCKASCTCKTPTISSVSGNPPNAGGDIVITGRYWGGTPSVTVDGRTCTVVTFNRTSIICTAPACLSAQNTGSVVIKSGYCTYTSSAATITSYNIEYNIIHDIFNDIIYDIFNDVEYDILIYNDCLYDQTDNFDLLTSECPDEMNMLILRSANANLKTNGSFSIESQNVSITAYQIDETQLHLIFKKNNASGLIPSDVAESLPANSAAVLTSYSFNPYVTPLSAGNVQFTNLVSLSVISLNGTEIHVHNTSSAIEIGMDYNAVDGYEIECVWWDNSTRGWNREGCTTDTSSQPVKCLCSHLTSFSLQVTPKEVPPSEIAAKPFPWKWVGVGVGMFVVFLVLIVFTIIIIMRKGRGREHDRIDLTSATEPLLIPTDQILPQDSLSSRVRRARYQLSNVVIVRTDGRDGQNDQFMQRLKHINIAQYLGCHVDPIGVTYLVNHYVPGCKGSQWINMGDYSDETAESVVMQLANVMTYLIDQGVTDNIVTAEKVIIQPDNGGHLLKLWDFRIGSKLPKLYTPPEKKLRTETAQVWAFGVLSMQIIDKTLYPQASGYTESYDDRVIPDSLTLYYVKQSLRRDPMMRPTFADICRREVQVLSQSTLSPDRYANTYQRQHVDPYSQNLPPLFLRPARNDKPRKPKTAGTLSRQSLFCLPREEMLAVHLFALFLVFLDRVDGQTQAQQRSDLMLLYNSAGGSSWTSKTNWGGSNPCTFYGVTCDGSGNVTSLRLENIGMQGTIPSGFGQNLGYMQILAITGHYAVSGGTKGVYGPLPSSITSMGNLQNLHLNSNELSGTLPNLSAFPKLIYADFEYNRFTGFSNPSGLSALTQLKRLWVYRNYFASIPSDVTSMSSVTSIRAECNYLTSSVPSGIWSMPNVNELSFGFQVRGDSSGDGSYSPAANRIPGIVPKSISTKTLLDLSGNAFDEFEDYTMGSPLGTYAVCDMSSKGKPSGPNFACPIPAWASSSCSATCSCYTPTTSSVSGNPPNAGGDIVITGRYWGGTPSVTVDGATCTYKSSTRTTITCTAPACQSSQNTGNVIVTSGCSGSQKSTGGTHDIVDDIIYNVNNIIHYIVYNEADNIDNILNIVDDFLHIVDDFLNNVDNILNIVDDFLHIVDNILYDVYYQTDHIYNVDNIFNNPSTFTTSSTTSSIPSTSSTTIATTTDIPFCDQIFLSFNRSLSSSVLQDQLRGIQPFATQCPEQLNAVVLQIASTNLQRNKTFVVEAGNISIAAGKIANGTQLHLIFDTSAASGLIPSDVADLLPVNSSAVLSLYAFNPYVTSSSTDTVQFTNVVSLSVTSADGTEVSVHNTSSAIEIGMDYNAVDGYEIECVWWDNSTRGWNREGCRTDTSSQPVKCLCNHLTSFSLQVTPKEVPPSNIAAKPFPWKWVGIGAGGFVFILAVALILIIVMTRKRKLKRNDNDFDMTTTNSTTPHVIPADQILPEGYLSPRVRKARYQLSNVIVVRAQAGDGLSDQLLQRLKHINIAQYLGCYVDTIGDTYFVTYYAPGTKMTEWIGMGNYDNETAHQTVLQLANVMAYLFDQNVNDYRLTADKIIVQPDTGGHLLKLWDFRLGSKLPKLYTPPEKKMRTEAALVWTFGVLSQQIIDKQVYTPNTPYTEYYNGEDIPESSVEFSVKQRCVQTSEKKRVTRDSLRKDPTKRPTFVELCRRGKEIASVTSYNASSTSYLPAVPKRGKFPSVYQPTQTSDPYSQIQM